MSKHAGETEDAAIKALRTRVKQLEEQIDRCNEDVAIYNDKIAESIDSRVKATRDAEEIRRTMDDLMAFRPAVTTDGGWTRPAVEPDPFLLDVARLAGVDPERVLNDGLTVRLNVIDEQAIVTADIVVDRDELLALAEKYGRR